MLPKALIRIFLILAGLAAAAAPPRSPGTAPVRIGVLAFRPKPQTLAQWRPLAQVLKRVLPERDFVVEALTYPELNEAVAAARVDFILTNPGHYVQIRRRFGLSSPLATLAGDEGGRRTSMFGGVIFTRAETGGMAGLADLRGRRIAFPDTESLGGYQMQAFELSRAGVHLPQDAFLVPTGMPHDNVVDAVLAGRADAGFVRSGTLEAMVREGKLDPARIRIIHRQHADYPAMVSTRLYPDWPFTALPGVDDRMAREVAAALFLLEPEAEEARAMKIQGFSVPADYAPVEDVLRELRLPPFDAPPGFTLPDVLVRYRWPLLAILGLLGAALLLGSRLLMAQREVRRAQQRALQQQEKLLASQDLFAKAFATSPDAINITRLEDGVYLAVNEGFTRITGYTAEDVVGHSSVSPATPLWADPADRQRLVDGLRERGEVVSQESRFRLKDGSLITGLISGRVLMINGEQDVITITRDITDLRRMERERAELAAQLQQSQKMESLGVLAGGVAHDMNNVLAAILGLASAQVLAQPAGSPARQAFGTIVKAAERGGRMVRSLLSFSRQGSAEVRELDVNELLREQVQLLSHTTLGRIRLEEDLQPGLRTIQGEASVLTHAFMNLCVNAVEAMPGGGTLTLRTRNQEDAWVEVQVEDTGTGMAPEVLAKAMDPFFTTKEPGKGTGLGLALVYSAIKAHQGRMGLASEPGGGTRVTLEFPACGTGRVPVPPAVPQAAPPRAGRPRTVLLVDDDEIVQFSIKGLLDVLGHATTLAASGEEAMARVSAGLSPDLVLLDMNMPGLGGAGTLPLLRRALPRVPVLLSTGRADQTALDLAAAHAGVFLLPKPFDLEELSRSLEALEA
jgi:PAS domain S-box-containing protein